MRVGVIDWSTRSAARDDGDVRLILVDWLIRIASVCGVYERHGVNLHCMSLPSDEPVTSLAVTSVTISALPLNI